MQMFSTMTLMGPPTKTRKPEPAVIEYKSMRFLITERPSEGNMEKFIAVRTAIIIMHWLNSIVSPPCINLLCTAIASEGLDYPFRPEKQIYKGNKLN